MPSNRSQDAPVKHLSEQYLINSAKKGLLFSPRVTECERNNIQSCKYQKDKKISVDISPQNDKSIGLLCDRSSDGQFLPINCNDQTPFSRLYCYTLVTDNEIGLKLMACNHYV